MTIQYDNIDTSISAVGSASNIPIVFRTKGTSALDLSAGSSGINISNGNTVTAITRTAAGSGYTSFPSVAISAPQIAGGTQATASVAAMGVNAGTVASGGTGYTLNDVLTVVGGTPVAGAATLTVTGVSGGVITSVSSTNFLTYSVLPTNPVTVTGGTGSGATLNLTYFVPASFTITNAGSGYVEQPTVTFSGGGGSGATAYATVGNATTIKSIGSSSEKSIAFQGPSGFDILQLEGNLALTSQETIRITPTTFGRTNIVAVGGNNSQMWLAASGTGYINFCTSGTALTSQFRVTHTASAVNYVQVTGSVTTSFVQITAQGSDTNVGLNFSAKGISSIRFNNNNLGNQIFRIDGSATNAVNYLQVAAGNAGVSPSMSAQGSDTDLNIRLTPKGAGRVQFGTHTGVADTAVSGYIEILDSGGTVRKLAVIT